MKFLGHLLMKVLMKWKYDIALMVQKIRENLSTTEGRKALQQAFGMMNLLKPHVQHYINIMGPFQAKIAAVRECRDWSSVDNIFKETISEVLGRHVSLIMHTAKGPYTHIYTYIVMARGITNAPHTQQRFVTRSYGQL